jgi:3-oxoacyl-[acyl-carrier protein] reductase
MWTPRQLDARRTTPGAIGGLNAGVAHSTEVRWTTGGSVLPAEGDQGNADMMIGPDLTKRTALVTGASRGIGRAVALALAGAGADIAVNYRERVQAAKETADAVRSVGRRALTIAADVSSGEAVAHMVHRVEAELGPVGILVNNAGIALRRDLDELTEADFDHTMAVNLKAAFLCTNSVLPGMRARGWGRIVNISSGAARSSGVIGVHYNASKAGLEGLTRGYAARLVKDGVTVNAVAPSLIETEMMQSGRDEYARKVPMGRLGTPEEVAQAVLMVVGNAYMTGQTIQVNGGMHFI